MKFIKYPICLHGLDESNFHRTLNLIVSFAIVNSANRISEDVLDRKWTDVENELEDHTPEDFNSDDQEDMKMMLVAHEKGILLGSTKDTKLQFDQASRFYEKFKKSILSGTEDIWTSIPVKLFFTARGNSPDDKKLRSRFIDLAIIAYVRGRLQTCQYMPLRIEDIQAGIHGYKTRILYKSNYSGELNVPSYKTIYRRVYELSAKNHFRIFPATNRIFYSLKVKSPEDLAEQVIRKQEKRLINYKKIRQETYDKIGKLPVN